MTYSVNGDGGYVADVSYTGEAQVFYQFCIGDEGDHDHYRGVLVGNGDEGHHDQPLS